jgi:hypothetical protein
MASFEPTDKIGFLVVGREHAMWVGHLRDNPRVAFHVADDAHAEHTRVLVPATYADRTLDRPRVLVSLTPVHWTSRPGREWHPRYR